MPFGLFSKLSKAERDKLAADDFGWPEKKLYPIKDASDVADAASLIGKAPEAEREKIKARIIAIAKRKGFPIPNSWKSDDDDTAKHAATFALDATTTDDGEYVLRTGKLFEAGDYSDKDFAISPEELQAACADFQPVPVDLGHGTHSPMPLDGKLGEVRSIALADDGWSLVGTVALPKWLDAVLGDAERKVSATWARGTKRLEGLALVTHPRVADAALMSAYATFASKHQTRHGLNALQDVHEAATRGGAVCSRSNTAEMASSREAKALQDAHDASVTGGAHCDDLAARKSMSPYFSDSPGHAGAQAKEGTKVSKFDQFMAWLRDDEGAEETPPTAPVVSTRPTAAQMSADAAQAEIDRLRKDAAEKDAENRRLRSERMLEKAVAFAEKVIGEGRAFPREQEALVRQYVQAATDDATLGVVKFADNTTKSRVEMFSDGINLREPNQLTAEQLGADIRQYVLRNEPDTTKGDATTDPERRAKLVEMAGDPERAKEIRATFGVNGTRRN